MMTETTVGGSRTTARAASARRGGRVGEPELRQLLAGLTAVRDGDFGTRLPDDADGLLGEIATVFNGMVDQLSLFTSEVTRVAREVGTDGRLGGQAEVPGVSGTWKDLTDSVNAMAGNLTTQVRDIAQVATAVAKGDLSQKIDVAARGEILELKETVNTMVDQLSAFADEVTRVAREVGSEGRLGGQAQVPGVGGVWRDLTDSVNFMAGNLTDQVRNIAQVTTAVAKGDLSQKITVDARGEILQLKDTINTMVDQLSAFADEVTRVAREVGTEGRLGGQADVKGVSGTWRDLTDSVNFMAGNLTAQVRNIAQVATAVAKGDLSQKITVDARGEILQLKDTINTMVDQLSAFADEVTRVAREVGTEGRLGGQADVKGVSGTWKDLTESVNVMADNLTAQVRNIAQVTTAVASGDLSQKIRVDARGEILELKETINTMVDQLSAFADEVTRVAREVGTEGILGGRARVRGVSGTWGDLTDNVNVMADNLTAQVRSITQVATAVARGDLSQKITVEAKGEVAALAGVMNTMVDTLSAFADEVTRVAREVGTEGMLGGQARVPNVAGTWKDLTDNVNSMANNLTSQVRNIAQVTTAVAQGDLTRKIDVDARGEILELKTTINTMVDQLSAFAAEVTRVAREVGSEGRLGGQAEVEGVSGTWKRLTENVNELAGNLTRQVRAIAEVTSAVAEGDLTRSITVDASGEVAELKDNINSMVESLRQSTRATREQDWLKTNLTRITGLIQGRRDLAVVAEVITDELTPLVGAQYGAFYLAEDSGEDTRLRMISAYGHPDGTGGDGPAEQFRVGQSLVGQAARSRRTIEVDDVPAGYVTISSGLGRTDPASLEARPTVVLIGQQHGDEPAGGEALLVIARELAPGGLLEPLLDRINVVLVPRANPDGAAIGQHATANGVDMNHDHLLLTTPEAQALARLVRNYRPIAVLDAHEYPAAGNFLAKFHAVTRYDALLQYATTANEPEFITKAAREWFRAPMVDALRTQGLTSDWYATTSADPQDLRVSMGGAQPGTGRNANGLKNAVSLLVATRGADIGRAHIQRRVHTQVTAIASVLRSTVERAADLEKVRSYVARDVSAQACHGQVTLEAAPTPGQHDLALIDPGTGADRTVRVEWDSSLELRTLKARARPCGYWIAPTETTAVERLRLLGLQVMRVAESGSVLADTYTETARRPAPGADDTVNVEVTPTRAAIDVPAGSYYVPLNQPLANLAVAALEPDTQGSYFAHRLITSLSDTARVMATPSLVFEESE